MAVGQTRLTWVVNRQLTDCPRIWPGEVTDRTALVTSVTSSLIARIIHNLVFFGWCYGGEMGRDRRPCLVMLIFKKLLAVLVK